MIDDPIVEEVYRTRQKILDECHGDVKLWIERLKAAELHHSDRIVTLQAMQEKRRRERKPPGAGVPSTKGTLSG